MENNKWNEGKKRKRGRKGQKKRKRGNEEMRKWKNV